VQLPEPVDDLYLPATHSVQGPPSSPVKPALHWQATAAEYEEVFAGQASQAIGPLEALNLPASQLMQQEPPDMEGHDVVDSVWPFPHVISQAYVLLPAGEKGASSGHFRQELGPEFVRATSNPYVPSVFFPSGSMSVVVS